VAAVCWTAPQVTNKKQNAKQAMRESEKPTLFVGNNKRARVVWPISSINVIDLLFRYFCLIDTSFLPTPRLSENATAAATLLMERGPCVAMGAIEIDPSP
jgi:hypothetical protein